MVRNPIQEKRIKEYFINATKEILIGEGIDALSVRNVAERAGYSYATLYNYFKGLPDLISFCILDFQNDCKDFIQSRTVDMKSDNHRIKHIITAYVDYFIQYPSLFNLFYIEKLSSNKVNHSAVLFLDELYKQEFDFCVKTEIFSQQEANNLLQTIKLQISGILLLYLNRSYPKDYKDFKEQLEAQLNTILKIK